ncbi:mediator of RNA polymerase II transcription subunit 1-like isoform X2 [Symsagittifera roscoffensis]|uniref:mediator of RNA polymerase II transcription subunit 1-like isoform X2 n=1 Tax=Symsagittifera roscoffensis TaxID=84072 RepID=UPI00307C24F8
MIHGEDAHDINLLYVGLVVLVFVLFIAWIVHRGIKKSWREKSIYYRKDSIKDQLKANPSITVPPLAEVSIRDGSRIRAWLESDKEDFKRRANRDPRRKKKMKKKLQEEQKKLSTLKLNGEIDEIAAQQLKGVDFAKKLPHMVNKSGILTGEMTGYHLSNRSFQDSRHSRYLMRRHSSFFGNKAAAAAGGGASGGGGGGTPHLMGRERERQNSITSQRSLFTNPPSDAIARLPSISSLPVHDAGFHPQRTSSFITVQHQPINWSSHNNPHAGSGSLFSGGSGGGGGGGGGCMNDVSFSDTMSFGPGGIERMVSGGVIESSLLEVDEDEVSSPGASLLVSSSHNHDEIDGETHSTSSNFFTFQHNLGAQSNKRRGSACIKDMNTELRNLLESSAESRPSGVDSGEEDEDDDNEDAEDAEEDDNDEEDFATGESDESVLSAGKNGAVPPVDLLKSSAKASVTLAVPFASHMSPSKSSSAIGPTHKEASNSSPSSMSDHKLFKKARNNSFTQLLSNLSGGGGNILGGGGSYLGVGTGGGFKHDLRKTFSLSSKAIDKMKNSAAGNMTGVIDIEMDSQNRLSAPKHIHAERKYSDSCIIPSKHQSSSSSSSKFQVEILPPDLTGVRPPTSRNTVLNTLTINVDSIPPTQKSPKEAKAKAEASSAGEATRDNDEVTFTMSDDETSPTHEEIMRTLSNTTTDYSDENGDTITSLKMIIAKKK